MIAISRTKPFRLLQKSIGSATYRLNTILVGLELVAAGNVKPRSLAVTWSQPTTIEQAKQIAKQSEIFGCTAAIVLAADAFDQFLRGIVRVDWLAFDQETRNIATKAKTRPKDQGGDYSVVERAEAIFSELEVENKPLLAGIELLSKWRNVIVHGYERESKLSSRFQEMLLEAREHFYDHYSHLNIDLAIQNFSERKKPVPKEVTSLIAIAQNASRQIDNTAIVRVAGDTCQVERTADRILFSYFSSAERNQSAWAEISEICQGGAESRRKSFLKVMERVGITEAKQSISAPISTRYIEDIVAMDRDAFAKRFSISRMPV